MLAFQMLITVISGVIALLVLLYFTVGKYLLQKLKERLEYENKVDKIIRDYSLLLQQNKERALKEAREEIESLNTNIGKE